ncbi:MAG TPA: hypothetical protein VFA71_02490 [Terriglobales bacterium]|nr:hypothetical protein [Terriglobales bacterium]
MKIRFLAVALIIFAAIQAYAGGTSCATATSLVPDGRILDFDNVQPQPSSNWYQFTATAGRSYSVELRDDVDPDNPDLTVTYYGPNSTCANLQTSIPTTVATVTDTHATEPAVTGTTKRVSIVTSATGGGTYWIQVQNTNASISHYVSVGVTETTIYASTWTTYGGFATQFILLNTTSQPVKFNLTLTAALYGASGTYTTVDNAATSPLTLGGQPSASSNVLVATNSTCGPTQICFSPAVPANVAGYVILTHNGPPGAVQAYENENNWSSYPTPMDIPIPIGPMRGK